jgi:hypothetical protein
LFIVKAVRSPAEEQDKFIFDLFRLGSAKEVSKQDLTIMLYNLPTCGFFSSSSTEE